MPLTEIEFKTILNDPWGVMRARIQAEIFTYREELEDEFGDFTIEEIPNHHEIRLIPEGPRGQQSSQRCYLSDWHADARLIIDDYWPTAEDYALATNQASNQEPDPDQVEE